MINHKSLSKNSAPKLFEFSICTIANNLQEYEEMKNSFEACGFKDGCEYWLADNSNGNIFNAYQAIKEFLLVSNADYVLIVHQDVRCIDKKNDLIKCLNYLSGVDSNWGICGNAGAIGYHQATMYIENKGKVSKSSNLPTEVSSLDENFLIIKSTTGITVSNNLNDFHLYGTDLCLIADVLGYKSYVIPFMVKHFGHGNLKALLDQVNGFVKAYGKKFRSRFIQTTCTKFYLSNSSAKNQIYNTPLIFFFIKFWQRIKFNNKLLRQGKKHKKTKAYQSL